MLTCVDQGINQQLQTKVHDMIAADCTIVNDDVCKDRLD